MQPLEYLRTDARLPDNYAALLYRMYSTHNSLKSADCTLEEGADLRAMERAGLVSYKWIDGKPDHFWPTHSLGIPWCSANCYTNPTASPRQMADAFILMGEIFSKIAAEQHSLMYYDLALDYLDNASAAYITTDLAGTRKYLIDHEAMCTAYRAAAETYPGPHFGHYLR